MTRIFKPGQPRGNASRFPLSKYMPDIAAILMVVIIAYMFAGKTAPDMNLSASPGGKPAQNGQSPDAVGTRQISDVYSRLNEDDENKNLRARNIFAASGAYTDADNKPIPAKPYTLIGVIQGKERKAVFRDYAGSVTTMARGHKMVDGSVITGIENASVQLEKGKEKIELKAFDIPDREKRILRKP